MPVWCVCHDYSLIMNRKGSGIAGCTVERVEIDLGIELVDDDRHFNNHVTNSSDIESLRMRRRQQCLLHLAIQPRGDFLDNVFVEH